ncbi:MAG: flavin reductase family protein [Ilumatobacteraceae bacterium]
MIDPQIKRCLGQMMHGVQVVGATHGGVRRAYTSHWVSQVSFDEPIVMASVSPKHDTFSLIASSGTFAVSILAGDQVAAGQYFSYPGRKFRHVAEEFLTSWGDDELPVVVDAVAWLRCEIFDDKKMADHQLFFGRVTDVLGGRLREPPLTYSSRLGWRIASEKAREPGMSIRDSLLERLTASGVAVDTSEDLEID